MGSPKRTGCPEKGAILEKKIFRITIRPFSSLFFFLFPYPTSATFLVLQSNPILFT